MMIASKKGRTGRARKLMGLSLLAACLMLSGCGGGGGGTPAAPMPHIQMPPATGLLKQLSAQGPVRIMPLGDSNTWGWFVAGSYRTQLYQDLTAAGVPTQFVGSVSNGPDSLPSKNNEGHSGWAIADIAGSADAWLKTYQPQIVLMMVSTNDIWRQQDAVHAPQNLSHLVDQITHDLPQATVVVASAPPLASEANNAGIVAYDSTIAPMVAAHAAAGEHVVYADIYSATPRADLEDEAHFNADGYAKMAAVWNNVLKGLTATP